MNNMRPGVLAIRALNQYRRRDVIAYLGLRYYLHNTSSRSDHWIKSVAPRLVMSRPGGSYFPAQHFKEYSGPGKVKHRPLFLPGANEALAEAALLDACSRLNEFRNPPNVYSYSLAQGEDSYGTFEHYSGGLRNRHNAIAAACDQNPGGVVRYVDIKRFYPSIDSDIAMRTWRKFVASSRLSPEFSELGERLILDHAATVRTDEKGILTGPMFSHLLANLVLRDFDAEMTAKYPGRYFRYVDDITMVGDGAAVASAISDIRSRLDGIGFELHGDDSVKSLEVSAASWLEGRDDFQYKPKEFSWMALIGGLKSFLVLNPGKQIEIRDAFRAEGLRIPVIDYNAAAHERGSIEKILERGRKRWIRWQMRHVTTKTLVVQALGLRRQCETELKAMLSTSPQTGFSRKRLIPQLRYRTGQIAYLSSSESLLSIREGFSRYSEMDMHSGVLKAVANADLDAVLPLGTNAAQAAAQPLRASGVKCTFGSAPLDVAGEQALAVFILNGVNLKNPAPTNSEFLRFASAGANLEIMKSGDPFTRELACLHGVSATARHPEMLESIFDEDERLALDAIEQLQESASQ